MKYFIIFVLAMIAAGCQKNVSIDTGKIPEEGMLLNTWQILGPFPAEGKEHFLEVDNLRRFGFDETTITFDEFAGIEPAGILHGVKNQVSASNTPKMDFNKLFGYTDTATISGNVYCACVLRSDAERRLKLNFSSDDGSKVWLNHTLVLKYDRTGEVKYYEQYIDLNLQKGDNLLLIKVNNRKYGWELFAALEEETAKGARRNKKTFALEYGNYYVQRSVITNDSISLNTNLPQGSYVLTVTTPERKKVLCDSAINTNELVRDISALKDGLYVSTLTTRGETFTESFYKGDIIGDLKQIIHKIQNYHVDAGTRRNIEALVYRYHHLLKPGNMGEDDFGKRDWDKKMIFLFTSLNRYYNNMRHGVDPEARAAGGLLKTYISRIDNGIQYYQLFVPQQYQPGTPIPLVIELPKFMKRKPHALETYRFANVRLFELFEDIADQFNVIILDPGCRTLDRPAMNTIDEADLWEAIGDVRKRYTIDTTRMYLRGACLSARSAMKLAVKYPDRFAAMALVAPELTVSTVDNVYLQQNEPLNYLKNITNLPILDIHSAIDPHSPVEVSDKLYEKAQAAGMKQFTYRRLPMEFKTYYSEEFMEDIFAFFSKHALTPSPRELSFSTSRLHSNKSFWLTLHSIASGKNASIHAAIEQNILTIQSKNTDRYTLDLKTLPYIKEQPFAIIDNGKKIFEGITKEAAFTVNPPSHSSSLTKTHDLEGPFADIFTVPFLVVLGTTGTAQETRDIQALADTLNAYWTFQYYHGFRMKLDRNVEAKDIAEYSLLLLGTPQSNLIVKRLAQRLPIKISTSALDIGKNTAHGSDLGFYCIYPNPENCCRSAAIIGYTNPSAISLGYEDDGNSVRFQDISNYGWYDFKVWDAHTSENILSGYFDSDWK